MNNQYDIIVVGAGIAGCVAAIKASAYGGKILLIDRDENALSKRAHREFLLDRDFKNLNIQSSDSISPLKGFIMITGNKLSFEIDYPENFRLIFLEGNVLLSKLYEIVEQKKGITFYKNYEVKHLLQSNGRYCGIELSTGEKFYSKFILLCTGLDSLKQFNIPISRYWPRKLGKYNSKIKITTRIIADSKQIERRFQKKAYWFYTKNMFTLYSLIPFKNFINCEAHFTNIDENDCIDNIKEFFINNSILKRLLQNFNVSNLDFHTEIHNDFGIGLPTSIPGLIIAGEAMNITSPVYLFSIYSTIYSAILAGELTGKQNESDYEKNWMENLDILIKDFDIVDNSADQYDAAIKWFNAVMENLNKYYPEIIL